MVLKVTATSVCFCLLLLYLASVLQRNSVCPRAAEAGSSAYTLLHGLLHPLLPQDEIQGKHLYPLSPKDKVQGKHLHPLSPGDEIHSIYIHSHLEMKYKVRV